MSISRLSLTLALVAALAATTSVHAARRYTWSASVVDSGTKAPIYGAVVNFTLIDLKTNRVTPKTCTTDSSGICSVEVNAAGGFFRSSRMNATVEVVKPGYSKRFDTELLNADSTSPLIKIQLVPLSRAYSPIIVDSQDLPISNAIVTYIISPSKESVTCKTDETGQCLMSFEGALTVGTVLASGYYTEGLPSNPVPPKLRMSRRITAEELSSAANKSAIECAGKESCAKLFSAAQIYLIKVSSQKLQIATDTIVETYNPSEAGAIGGRIIREPVKGDKWKVAIQTWCAKSKHSEPLVADSVERQCAHEQLNIYSSFKALSDSR